MGPSGARAMVRLEGRPAAPGIASGRLVLLSARTSTAPAAGDPGEERAALDLALAAARADLERLADRAAGEDARAIIEFQQAMLEDEALIGPAVSLIDAGAGASVAWTRVLDDEIAGYDAAEDAYFRARASDLRDLRDRVSRHLAGEADEMIPPGAIVMADDLSPTRFLATDWDGGGLVLHRGSATSHVAILARARGVPMVVGVPMIAGVPADCRSGGQEALLDADTGLLILDPDAATRRAFEERRARLRRRLAADESFLALPAETGDGETARILINVADPAELSAHDPAHCDGVGLVRTEFLFHGRVSLPDEAEQFATYRRILDWAAGRMVTIRTLDAGGDKPIPGVTRVGESNPFLGVRGVRLSLRMPELFLVQLRALVRAAQGRNLKIMVPMVTAPDELARCRELMAEAVAVVRAEGVAAAAPPLGMMVEVPAAALAVETFDAEFYSIGSNDLIQYVMAASRDEPELAALAEPVPALFGLIRKVVAHARNVGREVSLCGDLASDPRHIAALLDTGLRDLSVAPASLASVKAAVAGYRRSA